VALAVVSIIDDKNLGVVIDYMERQQRYNLCIGCSQRESVRAEHLPSVENDALDRDRLIDHCGGLVCMVACAPLTYRGMIVVFTDPRSTPFLNRGRDEGHVEESILGLAALPRI
jgi:hypothetical protein